jgi:hypothetical protein
LKISLKRWYIGREQVIVKLDEFKKLMDFPVLKGPYLGQRPPGIRQELFVKSIIFKKRKYAFFKFTEIDACLLD